MKRDSSQKSDQLPVPPKHGRGSSQKSEPIPIQPRVDTWKNPKGYKFIDSDDTDDDTDDAAVDEDYARCSGEIPDGGIFMFNMES